MKIITQYRKDDKKNDIKVVEKYIRSSASDTVIQTSEDTYDNNNHMYGDNEQT